MFNNLRHLLDSALGHQQHSGQVPQMLLGQAMKTQPVPSQSVPLGHAQGVESFVPQDNGMQGEASMDNILQPSYQNPQASFHGMFQQPTGSPMSQNIQSPGGSTGADPFGWQPSGNYLRGIMGR